MPFKAEEPKEKTVSKFKYEHTVWHLGLANKRMLIALCVVCFTFIITIVVFVHGYTVREKNWLETLQNLRTPAIEQTAGPSP